MRWVSKYVTDVLPENTAKVCLTYDASDILVYFCDSEVTDNLTCRELFLLIVLL